jgi:hypothetical protein
MKKISSVILLSLLFTFGGIQVVTASTGGKGEVKVYDKNVGEMLVKAAAEGLNSILLITDNQQKDVDAAMELAVGAAALRDQVMVMKINREDQANSDLVKELQLTRFPLPYVVILSPSGFIAAGVVPGKIEPARMAEFLPSPCYNQSLQARKDGKPSFILVYATRDAEYESWMKLAAESGAMLDPKPEIIAVHNEDAAEAAFLARVGYKEATATPQLFVVTPAGQTSGRFNTMPTASAINIAAKRVASGCASKCSSASSCTDKSKQECK